MNPTAESIDLKKIATINSLVLGAIDTAILLLVFYLAPNLIASFVFKVIQVLFGLGIVIYFCLAMRKKMGGYWSFREALTGIFILLFKSAMIVFFFTLIFGKFIDHSYTVKMKDIAIAKSTEMMGKWGVDQDEMDESATELNVSLEKRFNPSFADMCKSVCIMAIVYFIGALILAAIFKKEKPDAILLIQDESLN
jgi:hypothetical protein